MAGFNLDKAYIESIIKPEKLGLKGTNIVTKINNCLNTKYFHDPEYKEQIVINFFKTNTSFIELIRKLIIYLKTKGKDEIHSAECYDKKVLEEEFTKLATNAKSSLRQQEEQKKSQESVRSTGRPATAVAVPTTVSVPIDYTELIKKIRAPSADPIFTEFLLDTDDQVLEELIKDYNSKENQLHPIDDKSHINYIRRYFLRDVTGQREIVQERLKRKEEERIGKAQKEAAYQERKRILLTNCDTDTEKIKDMNRRLGLGVTGYELEINYYKLDKDQIEDRIKFETTEFFESGARSRYHLFPIYHQDIKKLRIQKLKDLWYNMSAPGSRLTLSNDVYFGLTDSNYDPVLNAFIGLTGTTIPTGTIERIKNIFTPNPIPVLGDVPEENLHRDTTYDTLYRFGTQLSHYLSTKYQSHIEQVFPWTQDLPNIKIVVETSVNRDIYIKIVDELKIITTDDGRRKPLNIFHIALHGGTDIFTNKQHIKFGYTEGGHELISADEKGFGVNFEITYKQGVGSHERYEITRPDVIDIYNLAFLAVIRKRYARLSNYKLQPIINGIKTRIREYIQLQCEITQEVINFIRYVEIRTPGGRGGGLKSVNIIVTDIPVDEYLMVNIDCIKIYLILNYVFGFGIGVYDFNSYTEKTTEINFKQIVDNGFLKEKFIQQFIFAKLFTNGYPMEDLYDLISELLLNSQVNLMPFYMKSTSMPENLFYLEETDNKLNYYSIPININTYEKQNLELKDFRYKEILVPQKLQITSHIKSLMNSKESKPNPNSTMTGNPDSYPQSTYQKKYIKYKQKYLELKKLSKF
jgi:hypothetical protein